MIKFWNKRLKQNIITQNLEFDSEIKKIEKKIKDQINKKFARSLAIRMVDSGSCNACEAECNALSNPYYNLERLGIRFVASPRHADVMLLSGVMSFNMTNYVIDAYNQMPSPKWVVAIGDCVNGGVFDKTYAINAPASNYIPITHYISGCPPSPKEIIKGILEFLEKI
jgi:Ni,Fe-hydrogenase III small subunit